MITLQLGREEFDLIVSGQKTKDYRHPSIFNKRKLLKKNKDGLFCENLDRVEIKFVNGFKKDADFIVVIADRITPIRFANNYEDKQNNFSAIAGACIIEINICEIIKK